MSDSGGARSPSSEVVRLFAALPGAHALLDPTLQIVAVTEGLLDLLMRRRDEVLGRDALGVLTSAPAARATLQAALGRAVEAQLPVEEQISITEELRGLCTSKTITNDEQEVEHIVFTVANATRLRDPRDEEVRDLTRRAERYTQLLDTAPDAMVVIDETTRITLVNVQAERLFGYSRAEMVGQPLDILIPDRFRGSHGEHTKQFFHHPSSRSMGSGIELFGRHKGGADIPIEVSLSPLRVDGAMTVSASIRDITQRRMLEAAARLGAERLASAVESIQDGFALFDDGKRLVLCNSVYRRLVGESVPGQLVGRTYQEILDAWFSDRLRFEDDAERARLRDALEANQEETSGLDVQTRDGQRLRVVDRRTPEGGVVETIWDITDDVRRAEELREARVAAEAGSAAKSEFLSSMSHELRTPLNAILGFTQLLQRDKKEPLSERHRERVEHILKGGEHLLRLIDDILDLSRIEAGAVSISTEPVGVARVIEEVRRTLEPMATRQNITLAIDAIAEGVPMIAADRTRFAQILMNFGSNGIKYNRPGGKVTFKVSQPTDDMVRVSVSDTGFGIPVDKQQKLFQPFQRAGQETGPIEGTGIGLVITRRLAELMHGFVGFSSVANEGSVFWVDMPSHHASALSAPPLVARAERSTREVTGDQKLVLYVEDNPANVTFMADLLASFETLDMLSVPTAELGIELATARRPSLIIMDINLPGMSGLDALRILRATAETRDIPVIALTAAASDRDKQRGLEAGFTRYLTKPVKVDEFMAAVEALVAKDT